MWTWLLPTDLKQLQNSGSVNVSFPLEHVLKNCFMQGSASYRSASSVSSTKPSALWSNNCLNTVRIGSRQPCFFEPETTKFSCNKFRLCSHPNLARILPILLENLESRSICNQDRKNPNFDIWYFQMNSYDTYTPNRVPEYTCWKWLSRKFKKPAQNTKKNQVLEQQAMKIMISIKMAMFSKHFRHKLSSQNTRNGLSEHKDFKLIRLWVLKHISWVSTAHKWNVFSTKEEKFCNVIF